ncbi:MAG: DsbA family protein [Actinomycetota bacterium]|nr:DsbA family protein [Actinomycetota bacterium]
MEWLPFDLHPEYPAEGVPRSELERRYGPDIHERTRRVIEAAGLRYHPPPRIPNSRRALAVTELARDRGLHEPVHSRLMQAYWSDAADLGDDDVLFDLVSQAGLDRAAAERAAADEEYVDRVLGSTRRAHAHGISAIPAFVLDDRLLVMGAQPHSTFEEAMTFLESAREA